MTAEPDDRAMRVSLAVRAILEGIDALPAQRHPTATEARPLFRASATVIGDVHALLDGRGGADTGGEHRLPEGCLDGLGRVFDQQSQRSNLAYDQGWRSRWTWSRFSSLWTELVYAGGYSRAGGLHARLHRDPPRWTTDDLLVLDELRQRAERLAELDDDGFTRDHEEALVRRIASLSTETAHRPARIRAVVEHIRSHMPEPSERLTRHVRRVLDDADMPESEQDWLRQWSESGR